MKKLTKAGAKLLAGTLNDDQIRTAGMFLASTNLGAPSKEKPKNSDEVKARWQEVMKDEMSVDQSAETSDMLKEEHCRWADLIKAGDPYSVKVIVEELPWMISTPAPTPAPKEKRSWKVTTEIATKLGKLGRRALAARWSGKFVTAGKIEEEMNALGGSTELTASTLEAISELMVRPVGRPLKPEAEKGLKRGLYLHRDALDALKEAQTLWKCGLSEAVARAFRTLKENGLLEVKKIPS